MGPDDLVIHKSIQLYDLSLEETIYRSDKKKKLKGYMLHKKQRPWEPKQSIPLTDVNKEGLESLGPPFLKQRAGL